MATQIDVKKLIEAMQDMDFKVRRYSGRAMYGKYCVGVVTRDPFELGLLIGLDLDSEMSEAFRNLGTRSDSLGLSTIFYWPSLEWPEGVEEEDEDEDEDY